MAAIRKRELFGGPDSHRFRGDGRFVCRPLEDKVLPIDPKPVGTFNDNLARERRSHQPPRVEINFVELRLKFDVRGITDNCNRAVFSGVLVLKPDDGYRAAVNRIFRFFDFLTVDDRIFCGILKIGRRSPRVGAVKMSRPFPDS